MDFYMAKNIRKAVLLLAMLSVIVGMFTACSNKKSDDGRTTFTVGFDAEFPPYGYKDDNGEYVGFDLSLAEEVCKRNGWELVKQPIDWDSKDMELASGTIDCIWNGFTMNGRESDYTWTTPYIDNSQVVIVKSGSAISQLSDLAGKVVVVQADSSALAAFTGDDAVKAVVEEAHKHGVKVVASNHDFDKTPAKSDIIYRLRKMQELGADIPKIAVMPQNKKDVLTLLAATEEMVDNYADRPIITMSMAGTGVISRLCGEVFGSSMTFGAAKKASAPGQMGVNDLNTVLGLLHGAM